MEINRLIDHTLLKAFAKDEDIVKLCEEAKEYYFKSVCVNPANVGLAKKLLEGSGVLVCTVIGFPLGANTVGVKAYETADAVANGADEIDMVINIGKAKMHDYTYIENEIASVVNAAGGKTVKVIIETCYLDDEEKREVCMAAARANANFVKTSTGFGTGGANVHDVEIMKASIPDTMEVKASGGIRDIDDFLALYNAGATRIGASSGVKIMGGNK